MVGSSLRIKLFIGIVHDAGFGLLLPGSSMRFAAEATPALDMQSKNTHTATLTALGSRA
jgi:hypothetical protein